MQSIRTLLSIVMLSAFASHAAAEEWVVVGSWNIENLGARQQGQHPKALAEHVQLAGVDVLALQEIHDDDGTAATRSNKKLDAVVEVLNAQDGHDWAYELFPKRDSGDDTQLTGVAWNKKRVSRVGALFKVPVVDDDPQFQLWERHPHAAKFSAASGKTDFVVIPLHMKSNIVENGPPKLQRKAEAAALVAALPAVSAHFGDGDLVLIGDMNCLRSDEAALESFAGAGFIDLNSDDRATYVSDSPFDRILLKDGAETKFSRQYVLTPADRTAHDEVLSDHYMIVSPLRVVADDD